MSNAQKTIEPPYEAKAIANLLLDWAESQSQQISPMKLQKLIFFCHADYFVQFQAPLIKQEFEAWDYGPVIPSIYQEFKKFGKRPISSKAMIFDPVFARHIEAKAAIDPVIEATLKKLFNFYLGFTAAELSEMSHENEGAWRQARSLFANGLNINRRISASMIERFHSFVHQ